MGAPPGGPGREAEELAGCGSAYGAHTISHRQRKGEVSLSCLSYYAITALSSGRG